MSSVSEIRKANNERQSLPEHIQKMLNRDKPFCREWTADRFLKLEMPKQLIILKLLQLIVAIIQPFVLSAIFNNLQNPTGLLHFIPIITAVLLAKSVVENRISSRMIQLSANMRHALTMALFRNGLRSCPEREKYLNIEMMNSHIQALTVYHTNFLSAFYETFRMLFAISFLWYKMKEIVIVAVLIGFFFFYFNSLILYKIPKIYERILKLRKKKINLITLYQTRLVDIKMSRLEQYIYDKMLKFHSQQHSHHVSLRIFETYNFTSIHVGVVCITSLTLIVLKTCMSPQDLKEPIMVIISILVMLLMPLNVIPWNVAAIKRAWLCRDNIQKKFENTLSPKSKVNRQEKGQEDPSIIFGSGSVKTGDVELKVKQIVLTPGVYSVKGPNSEAKSIFLESLAGLADSDYECKIKGKVGFVDSDLSLLPDSLNSIFNDLDDESAVLDENLRQLLISYHCLEIPLKNGTLCLASGQKLRLALVRSTLNRDIVIVDANLGILDRQMKEYIENQMSAMAKNHKKIFIITTDSIVAQKSIVISKDYIELQTNRDAKSSSLSRHQQIKDKYCSVSLKPLDQIFKKHEPKKIFNDPYVAFKFYKMYFKSKIHIAFLFALAFSYNIKRYYSIYILKISDEKNFKRELLIIVILYIACVALRAVLFAVANLKEWNRLTRMTIKTLCFDSVQNQMARGVKKNINIYQNECQSLVMGFTSQLNTLFSNMGEIFLTIYMVMLRMPLEIFLTAVVILFVFVKLLLVYRSRIHPLLDVAFFSWLESIDVATNTFKNKEVIKASNDQDLFTNEYNRWTSNVGNARAAVGTLDIWLTRWFQWISIAFLVVILFCIAADFEYLGRNAQILTLIITFCVEMPDKFGLLIKSMTDVEREARTLRSVYQYYNCEKDLEMDRMSDKLKQLIVKNDDKSRGLQIRNLQFKYESDSRTIFKNFNLEIKPGEKVLIKGRSDVGKTTLLKLFTGFLKGCPIECSGFISYSPANPLVFEASLQQNIDPYGLFPAQTVNQYVKKFSTADVSKMTLRQKMRINMYRAQLYGQNGVVLYNQPTHKICQKAACLIVSNRDHYNVDRKYQLVDGKLQQL